MNFFWQKQTNTDQLDGSIRAACEYHGTQCQVLLSGRITIDSTPDLRVFLLQHMESSACQGLTVDFCDVVYVDTSGFAMLLEILKAARTQGKTLQLSGLRERPRYALEATRLLRLFEEVNRESPCISQSRTEGLS